MGLKHSSVHFCLNMKFITLQRVIAITMITIAAAAAFFSVTGIGKLFAGAMLPVSIMAATIELGKLVGISFLYRYWNDAPKLLRRILLPITAAVMIVTSAGIYGYLSAAYAKVAANPLRQSGQVALMVAEDSTLSNDIRYRTDRLSQLMSLRAQQETRLDTAIAKSVTGNNRTVVSVQATLNNSDRDIKRLQTEISGLNKTKDSLTGERIKTQTNIETNSDIGSFLYVAKALGVSLDTVVKWFILLIVFVFDPLSISLLLAYNFLVKRNEITDLGNSKGSEVSDTLKVPKAPTEAVPEDRLTNENKDPHYTDEDYDWDGNKHVWEHDQAAVNYYNYIESFGKVPHPQPQPPKPPTT